MTEPLAALVRDGTVDLLILECYTHAPASLGPGPFAQSLGGVYHRVGLVKEADLLDKAIICLGHITDEPDLKGRRLTPDGLRTLAADLRKRFPECPGIAFYQAHERKTARELIQVCDEIGAALLAKPNTNRVRKHFKSDSYTVEWGAPRTFEPSAELEIGDGSGHGFTLNWLRFRPDDKRVEILSIRLDEGRHPYKSKWPPDRAPVTVIRAEMKPDAYAALLRDLAIVNAAKLRSVPQDPMTRSVTMSSSDFWGYARLTAKDETLVDLDWAGYEGSYHEIDFARPQVAVELARAAVKGLDFKEHALTGEERAWASAKFVRDWKKIKDAEFHWWVRERYIIMVGVVGDASALSALRDALQGAPKDRCVYYAINAITRLTKQDVRDKPVEEMDVEKTRQRVVEMLRDRK